MCGLVGVVGKDITYVSNKVFKQLLYVDALRGSHSTGIARNDHNNVVTTYKRALNATDFLQLTTTSDMVSDLKADFLMGHNRYATQGAVNDENAHPFTYGNVTLCHNGTLVDQTTLPDHKDFVVDSENIAYAMGLADNPKDVISKLIGAFALTWYNDYEMKYYIVRNSERPMFIAKQKDKDIYYYASEEHMLHLVLQRNGVKYELHELPVGQMVSFDLKGATSKMKQTKVKLAPKPKPKYQANYGYNNWNTYDYKSAPIPKGKGVATTTKVGHKKLHDYNLKSHEEIEFYSHGLPDAKPSNKVGTMTGTTTDVKPVVNIKCYNQPMDSLAGYYTALVQTLIYENGEPTLIVSEPWLSEVIETDVNNEHRKEVVDKLLKKDSVLLASETQRMF